MNLPDFRNHEELNKLRELMGAEFITNIDEKLKILEGKGITIKASNEVKPDSDGTILYGRQKVALYIRNAKYYVNKYEGKYPKYHIVDCEVLNLKGRGRYNYQRHREGVGRPTIEEFTLNLSDNPDMEKLETHRLNICQKCLKKLELIYQWNGRNVYVYQPDEFPLSDWFDAIDDGYEPLPIDRIKSEGSYYIAAWKFLSWVCRKNAQWKCQGQECGIELGQERSDRRFLHAHHIKGTRYNKPADLRSLCIGCHAEQPGEGHQRLKGNREYQEFMEKFGAQWNLS